MAWTTDRNIRGPAGKRGTWVLRGHGAPTDNLGLIPGDRYLDTDTNILYLYGDGLATPPPAGPTFTMAGYRQSFGGSYPDQVLVKLYPASDYITMDGFSKTIFWWAIGDSPAQRDGEATVALNRAPFNYVPASISTSTVEIPGDPYGRFEPLEFDKEYFYGVQVHDNEANSEGPVMPIQALTVPSSAPLADSNVDAPVVHAISGDGTITFTIDALVPGVTYTYLWYGNNARSGGFGPMTTLSKTVQVPNGTSVMIAAVFASVGADVPGIAPESPFVVGGGAPTPDPPTPADQYNDPDPGELSAPNTADWRVISNVSKTLVVFPNRHFVETPLADHYKVQVDARQALLSTPGTSGATYAAPPLTVDHASTDLANYAGQRPFVEGDTYYVGVATRTSPTRYSYGPRDYIGKYVPATLTAPDPNGAPYAGTDAGTASMRITISNYNAAFPYMYVWNTADGALRGFGPLNAAVTDVPMTSGLVIHDVTVYLAYFGGVVGLSGFFNSNHTQITIG